jgi:hypothetical protein
MPDTREDLFSIAVFPYLKTSRPVQFGSYFFRSTDDLEGLSAEVTAMSVHAEQCACTIGVLRRDTSDSCFRRIPNP